MFFYTKAILGMTILCILKKNEKNKTLPFLQLKGNDSISPSHQYFFNPDGKIDKLIDNTKNVISNYSYPNSFLQIIKYQSTSTGSIYRTDSCFLNAENKIVKIRTLGKTLKDSLLSIYDYKNNNISKQIIQHKTFTRTDTISYSYDEIKPNPFATLEISSFFIFENQAPMPDKQIKQIVYTQNSSNKIERRFFYYEAEFNQADKLLKFNIFDNLISRTPLFVILPIRKP